MTPGQAAARIREILVELERSQGMLVTTIDIDRHPVQELGARETRFVRSVHINLDLPERPVEPGEGWS